MIWPGPDMRAGTTLHLITDTHFGAAGNADWLHEWMDRAAEDIVGLKDSCHGHVDTGDCIHWDKAGDQPTEDSWYVAWRDKVTQDGLPFALTDGNHDLDSFDSSNVYANRTSAQWARDVGWTPGANNVTDIGQVRVISFAPPALNSPDPGAGGGVDGWFLSDATLDWIEAELAAADRPCFLATHCPLYTQYPVSNPNNMYNIDLANPRLVDIIGAQEAAVGVLTGHVHVDIDNVNHARVLNVGGRNVFSVNGPPCGGGRMSSVAAADHQWQNPAQTMYLTYDGGKNLTLRWRDHLRRQWTTSAGDLVRTITLP